MRATIPEPDLRVFIAGTPAPKGSKKAFAIPSTGRIVVTESAGVRLKDWARAINDVIQPLAAARSTPLDEPLRAEVQFVMRRPKIRPERRFPYPDLRPDLDKLVRAVLDPLVIVGVITDDARFVELAASKVYTNDESPMPGAWIEIWTMARYHGWV